MISFAQSASLLLCVLLAWTAHGQLKWNQDDNSQGNVTVISVQCTTPTQGGGNYEFTFKLSNGEELTRDGRLREVNGKKEIVMTGYVQEIVNGKTYRLRYVADENGEHCLIASREKAGILDRNLLPSFIYRPGQQRPPTAGDTHFPGGFGPPPAGGVQFPDGFGPPPAGDARSPGGFIPPPSPRPAVPAGAAGPTFASGAATVPIDDRITTPAQDKIKTPKPKGSDDAPNNSTPASVSGTQIDSDGAKQLPCTSFSEGCIPKMDEILDDLMEKGNYDKQIRPGIYEEPTQVWADFHIRGLLGIDEVNMEFKMSVALTLDWIDYRLTVDGGNYPSNFVFPQRVLVDEEQAQKIWTPRVTVLNEKESVDYSDIFDKGSLVWDPYRGHLIRTTYGVLTLSCDMSLYNFPMDTQICSAMVGSNFYGSDEIDLTGNFKLDPIFSNSVKNMELAGYGQHRIVTATAESSDVHRIILVCNLLMKRHVGYYLIGTYFPAALVVIISWLTFWMPREGSAERMALGVTCVLTITTLLISSQSSSPKVSYIKAIDTYMGVCFGLVFTTLLQSTLIGHWLRKGIIKDGVRRKFGEVGGEGSESNNEFASVVKSVMAGGVEMHYEAKILKQAKMSDAWSRVLFPLLFVVFNVAYWSYYGTIWSDLDEAGDWKIPDRTEVPITEAKWFGKGEI